MSSVQPAREGRRCKPRELTPEALRPSDLLTSFVAVAMLYLAAAVAVAAVSHFTEVSNARWIVLHLVFVGAVSQLILGAAQFFAGAFLAIGPPPRSYVRAEFALWNLGAIALALGGPFNSIGLTVVSAILLAVGLGVFKLALRAQKQRSLQEMPWATRWYQACSGFLVVGVIVGALVARGFGWSHGDLVSAHVTLNVIGWIGMAIVGTLHTFYPSISGTVLRFPKLQKFTYYSWLAGTAVLAAGFALSLHVLLLAGLLLLLAAATLIFSNIAGSALTDPGGLSLPAKLVGGAQIFLPVGLLLLLIGVPANDYVLTGTVRSATTTLLLAGWVGLTVAGSLIHLLAVIGRIRNLTRQLPPLKIPFEDLIAPVAVISLGFVALAQLLELRWLVVASSVAFGLAVLPCIAAVVALAVRAVTAAPLKL